MAAIDVSLAADIRCLVGSTGTGKSHYTKAEIRKSRRVMIWDAEDEYSTVKRLALVDIPKHNHRHAGKQFKIRFVPSMEKNQRAQEFNLFCAIAFATGDVLLIVEELRFVTSPSHAPEHWAMCTSRGRKRGVRIIGTSQRPASIDKDFIGNASLVRIGALGYGPDRDAVLAIIGLQHAAALDGLTGHQALIYTKKDRRVTRSP